MNWEIKLMILRLVILKKHQLEGAGRLLLDKNVEEKLLE